METHNKRIFSKAIISHLITRLVLTTFFHLLFINTVLAEISPESRVSEIIERFRNRGGPSLLIDYVYWETAFAELPETERKRFGIKSPTEFKDRMRKFFSDPASMIVEEAKKILPSLKQEQRQLAEQHMHLLPEIVKGRIEAIQSEIKRTRYQIGKATIDGDRAKVEISTTLDGKTETHSVNLIKVDNVWYLPSIREYLFFGQFNIDKLSRLITL